MSLLSSSFFPLPPVILSCSAIFLPLIFIPLSRPSLSSRPYLVVEARSCRNQSFFGLRTLSKEWKSRRGRISTEVDFLIEIEIEIEVSSRSKFRSRSRRSRSARRSLVEVQVQTEVYSKSKSRRSRSLVEVEVSSKSKCKSQSRRSRRCVEVKVSSKSKCKSQSRRSRSLVSKPFKILLHFNFLALTLDQSEKIKM